MPAVGALCEDPIARPLKARYGAAALTRAVRAVLSEARTRLAADPDAAPTTGALLEAVEARLADGVRETLFPVINATGVVIHTNLGRAPLAPEAVAAAALAAGYANLELDLVTGRRSSRQEHLDPLIAEMTGAEGGLAVNNCAGAVL
ncbi:MAG: L-seryl-tRNA(Sec) selenium transferase, partial [Phenylobacterium sp.]|nr:L-seryl-tRNA(Sec) selenium transferase [Phenylobacterium sp.]